MLSAKKSNVIALKKCGGLYSKFREWTLGKSTKRYHLLKAFISTCYVSVPNYRCTFGAIGMKS